MTIAPWLIPPDFIGAAHAGASAGLQRSQIATGASEAAGRLGLGYAQLAQESANAANRAAAEREQAAAAMALRRDDQNSLNTYRQSELQQKDRAIGIDQQRADTYAADALKKTVLAKSAAKIFKLAGSSRSELNKAITGDPDLAAAAATLTGPQWGFILPKEPTVSVPIPQPGDFFGHNSTRVSGPIGAVLPLVGTNAPAALRNPGVSSTSKFDSEEAARAAGFQAGDEVYLNGVGRVRLK